MLSIGKKEGRKEKMEGERRGRREEGKKRKIFLHNNLRKFTYLFLQVKSIIVNTLMTDAV